MAPRTFVGTDDVVGNDDQMRRHQPPWLMTQILDMRLYNTVYTDYALSSYTYNRYDTWYLYQVQVCA